MLVQLDVLNCHEHNIKIILLMKIIIHVFLVSNVRLFLTVIHHIAHYLQQNVFLLYVFF